ncbi:MAG TPA: hypothetical protein VGQ42_00590 [Candidatus Dormibacteraeota bacterium]|jgi:hypothetical protein|nr:hypothetical protein [Candidatus Dormibacteraeota bacterium]
MPLRAPTLRRAAALAILAAISSAAALVAPGPSPARAATAPGFATPTIVDPVNLYGEPDLRQDPKPGDSNIWYASGPWGTGTQLSIWNRSADGTHTFRELHDHPDPLHTGGTLRQPPGGGDTEIAVDHTGKFYGADLGALITQKAIVSTDQGATVSQDSASRVFQDPNAAGTDRQWFGLWDPPNPAAARAASGYTGDFPVNYMVYLRAVDPACTAAYATSNASVGCEMVASSVPSGSNTVGLDYGCSPSSSDLGSSNCPQWLLSGDGSVFIDQLTGKVVQAIDYQDPTSTASPVPDQAAVEVLTPGTDGYMKTVTMHPIYSPDKAGTHALFPVVTEDAQRNAYYIWVERPSSGSDPRTDRSWQVFYSWSPPGANSQWDHWSAPIRVSSPPSNTAIMPWAVAGGNGNLDVAWYGTDSRTSNPEDETASAGANWYVYMAQVTGANTGSPSISQVKAYDRPMHHGSICLSGTGCIQKQGNRNLADFFEITADAQGAAYIVFDNTANDLIQQVPVPALGNPTVPEGVVDHKGAEVVEVVRQVSGTGLNGTPITSPTDIGVNGITSGAGDALYEPIAGTNYPGLDIRGVSMTRTPDKLSFTIQVTDPSQIAAAQSAITAPFVDFVVRWEYNSTLYFAAAEVPVATGTPTFFDGQAASIDLCSVSACDPHIMTYPGPTISGASHTTTGKVTNAPAAAGVASASVASTTPGTITIDVPRADVGNPKEGERLDSVGAYSLLSLLSFDAPLPQTSAQNDKVPIEVDGACCFTPLLSSASVSTGTPSPTSVGSGSATPTPTSAVKLPNTAGQPPNRPGLVAAAVAAVLGLVAIAGRRRATAMRVRISAHRRRRDL